MKKTHHEANVRKLIMLGAALTLQLGLPFAFANRAFAEPIPKFAYVANECVSDSDCSVGNVSAYTINRSTGALRAVAGSPFAGGSQPVSVAVDPTGRFAYVVNDCVPCKRGSVSAYTINSATGALREVAGSPFAAGRAANWVAVDSLGRFVYVSNFGDATISVYTINHSTGALRAVAGSPFAAGEQPISVTADPLGRFVYVTNSGVSAFTINNSTGALSIVPGSPFATGDIPISVTVDPLGRFVYVGNSFDGSISAYTINRSTGALRAVARSPFPAGNDPYSVTVDPSGRFAYAANQCDASIDCRAGTVSAYTINSSTGALRAVADSPFAAIAGGQSITVDPSGQFAYVANEGGNVSAYAINGSTGALTAVAGSPFAAGTAPFSVAIAGQAVTTSVLTLAPRSLAFGDLPINTSSAAQSVTVTNTSANAVAITSIALRGRAPKQFAFTDDCGKSLAAYASCTLDAIFKPTAEGAKTAYLDVNGGGGGRSVMLTGTGT